MTYGPAIKTFAVNGYQFFEMPKAAAIVEAAIKIAQEDSANLKRAMVEASKPRVLISKRATLLN